jgi:UDP-N-acetylglucosamine 2-epimerase (non-hydrolysing)
MVGNTVVDAVYQNLKIAEQNSHVLKQLDLTKREYFVATVHRQENVDDKRRFEGIIGGLKKVQSYFCLPVVYPIHPRAQKQLKGMDLDTENLRLIEPLDYLGFLQFEANARLVLSDSGGVQEETCILGVPCVTLRDNTERPETLDVGSNILAGTDPERILAVTKASMSKTKGWVNPFGDGTTAKKIINILKNGLT